MAEGTVLQRVEQELDEVALKLTALNKFINTPSKFQTLGTQHKHLLRLQATQMEGYALVLEARIRLLILRKGGN